LQQLKDIYSGPNHKMWLTSVRYFKNPFLKTSLVNNYKLFPYHLFSFYPEIRKLYPNFDLNLIKKYFYQKATYK